MKRSVLYFAVLAICAACSGTNDPSQEVVIDYEISRLSPLMFRFDNRSTGCDSYRWDFGDGTWSESADALHTYEAIGTYTVTMTVTANGERYNKSMTVDVSQPDVYVAGFVIYHIPYENKYYRLVFKDDALLPSSWDFQTSWTPMLCENDLPYAREWSEPKLLENFSSHSYYTIEVQRNNTTSGGSETQCMKKQLKVKDIQAAYNPEYILQTETGSTAIGVLMEYDY